MTAAYLKVPEYDSRLYGHIGEERTKTLYYETSGAGQPGQLDAAGQVFESVAVQGSSRTWIRSAGALKISLNCILVELTELPNA